MQHWILLECLSSTPDEFHESSPMRSAFLTKNELTSRAKVYPNVLSKLLKEVKNMELPELGMKSGHFTLNLQNII